MKSGVAGEIRDAGGQIFAITSEPQSLATEAEETWELDFPAIGDPHHEILETTRSKGWLEVFVNEDPAILQEVRDWVSHPNGYFQPGILALSKKGKVLYRWRSRPTRENVGGAIMRPTAEYTWQQIKARLNDTDQNSADAPLDTNPEFDAKPVAWPLFMTLLLANGWFLQPRAFPEGRSGEKVSRPKDMFPRMAIFTLIIIAAFVFLPLVWATLGLAAWAAFIAPKIARYNREFQNIPE